MPIFKSLIGNKLKTSDTPISFQEDNINQPDDRELLKKFQKIISFSPKIKQTQAAEMLGIDPSQLTKKLFEWSDQIPFQIIGEDIVVNDLQEFTSQLDAQFEDWGEKELTKDGKLEDFESESESPQIFLCPICDNKIVVGTSPCPNCQSEIDWS
jgi:Bacterial regulatory protein, Fis family